MLVRFRFFSPGATDRNFVFPKTIVAAQYGLNFYSTSLELSVFISNSFSKRSNFWMVLELRDLCELSTDSQNIYSVNRRVAVTEVRLGGLSAGSEITKRFRKVFKNPVEIYTENSVGSYTENSVGFLHIQILHSAKIRPRSFSACFWESF